VNPADKGQRVRYRFVLSGVISPKALEPLQPVSYDADVASTQIQVDVLDDAHLQGVIELLNRLGAHLESFQQIDVFQEMEAPSNRPSPE
jgi:hypothetical protein